MRRRDTGPRVIDGHWFCEGHFQADGQLDIWQCTDVIEADQQQESQDDEQERRGSGVDQ